MGQPLLQIAENVADCLSVNGYAFIEDDQLSFLAETLADFLRARHIEVHDDTATDRFAGR